VDVLIEARARSAVEADWLVVGDGPLRAGLERRAAEAGRARVRFTGSLNDEEVIAILRRATVFALPCRVAGDLDRDALPVALTEALAAGLPVVTTDVGGIGEVVQDGKTGLLVNPDDPDGLAAAIDRVLGDRELSRRLGEGALQAVADYDISACVTDLQRRFDA